MGITDEDRQKMFGIAQPGLLDLCADPFLKDTAMLLLSRIEKKGSGIGDIILELMLLAYEEGKEEALPKK